MKYMLLAYTKQADWDAVDYTSPEFLAMCEFYEHLGKELTESGELVMTEGLGDPSLTRTVRRRDGGPVAVDGPYAEVEGGAGQLRHRRLRQPRPGAGDRAPGSWTPSVTPSRCGR